MATPVPCWPQNARRVIQAGRLIIDRDLSVRATENAVRSG